MATYFSVEWKNNQIPKQAKSILIIDRGKWRITYADLTMRGDVLLQKDGPLQASCAAQFFSVVNEALNQWRGQTDFSEPSSEDFCWKIKIRSKTGKIHRISGTMIYPPMGDALERELRILCEDAGIHITCIK